MRRLALVLFLGGCGAAPALHVSLNEPTSATDLFASVSQLELTVTRDDKVIGVHTTTHPSSISISGLAYGADTLLELEGQNSSGNTLARGATCATDFEKHSADTTMYFAPVGYFGATSSAPSVDRTYAAAGQAPGGSVLVAGGVDASKNVLSSVDVFTPGTATFAVGPSLNEVRSQATVTSIPSVALVLFGGVGSGTAALGSAELYFSSSGAFTEITTVGARVDHQAVLLSNGDLLVSGGLTDASDSTTALASTQELFVSSDGSNSVTGGPTMLTARYAHAAALVGETYYVFGGYDSTGTLLGSIEYFAFNDSSTPATPSSPFTSIPATLMHPRAYATATTITYEGVGEILVAGGRDASGAPLSAELYDLNGRFVTQVPMNTPRYGHTATLVNGGSTVLITGGFDASNSPIKTVELFDVSSSSFVNVTTNLNQARANHAAVTSCDGTVLLVGGGSGAELYTPSSD